MLVISSGACRAYREMFAVKVGGPNSIRDLYIKHAMDNMHKFRK
jgi:hypothetical protein